MIDLFEVRLSGFINGIDDTYGERFLTMTVSFLPCLSFGGLPSCFSRSHIDLPKHKLDEKHEKMYVMP